MPSFSAGAAVENSPCRADPRWRMTARSACRNTSPTLSLTFSDRVVKKQTNSLPCEPDRLDRLGQAPTTGANGVNRHQGDLGGQVLATRPHLRQRFLAGKGIPLPQAPQFSSGEGAWPKTPAQEAGEAGSGFRVAHRLTSTKRRVELRLCPVPKPELHDPFLMNDPTESERKREKKDMEMRSGQCGGLQERRFERKRGGPVRPESLEGTGNVDTGCELQRRPAPTRFVANRKSGVCIGLGPSVNARTKTNPKSAGLHRSGAISRSARSRRKPRGRTIVENGRMRLA